MSLLNQTVQIVGAFLSRNELQPQSISPLIQDIHQTLTRLSNTAPSGSLSAPVDVPMHFSPPTFHPAAPPAHSETVAPTIPVWENPPTKAEGDARLQPAIPIDQAVSRDLVSCLVCGKSSKTLRGHLTRAHSLDVDKYRELFGLSKDFPIVAPSYSEKRRQLARDSGLGEKLQEGRRRKAMGG